jgi:opacity protein-like surface antigen
MQLKKSFIILLCLAMPCFALAQDSLKRKEIGLTFINFDGFGITYRTGTEKSLWRFNTLFIGGNSSERTADSSFYKQSDAGFGIQVGKEYRKLIANNFELRLGVDLSFAYSKQKSESGFDTNDDYDNMTERKSYSPGIKLVFGVNYVLAPNLVIGAELLPGVSYSRGTVKDINGQGSITEISDISGVNYALSNSSALLSLVYRF